MITGARMKPNKPAYSPEQWLIQAVMIVRNDYYDWITYGGPTSVPFEHFLDLISAADAYVGGTRK